jgi:hypothetical protein
MRMNGSVSGLSLYWDLVVGANKCIVFRAAHDSAKGMRTWMADLQKK